MNENWVNLKSQIVMSNHDQILMLKFTTLNGGNSINANNPESGR